MFLRQYGAHAICCVYAHVHARLAYLQDSCSQPSHARPMLLKPCPVSHHGYSCNSSHLMKSMFYSLATLSQVSFTYLCCSFLLLCDMPFTFVYFNTIFGLQRALLEQKQRRKRQEPLMVQPNTETRPRRSRTRRGEEQAPLVESQLSIINDVIMDGKRETLVAGLCCITFT